MDYHHVVYGLPIRRDQPDPLNPNSDPNVGSSRGNASSTSSDVASDLGENTSTSLSALVTTLVPALVIAVFWFGLFLIFRRTQRRWYAPRTHLPGLHKHERSPELPSGWVDWFVEFLKISDNHVLHHSSLDGYLFLRFLRVLCAICFMGCLITWPVLFPINAVGGKGNTQLDALSFSNVKDQNRYYAHVAMAYVFFTFVFYVITRESMFYAHLRQAYLNSPAYANRISSRTVLFMSVPEDYKDIKKLRQVFGESIRRIWITSECKELRKMVYHRDRLAYRLESAETKCIRSASRARSKAMRKTGVSETSDTRTDSEPGGEAWLHKVKRPTHRPHLFGPKVDSIRWWRSQLARAIEDVEALQQAHRSGEAKYLSAVFVEFESQNSAQIALQTLSHHQPLHMTPRFIGISPMEVVWSALNLSWWQRIVRKFLVQGGITALIIFWSFPSAIVGTISNVSYLTHLIPFLRFIEKLPEVIKGTIAGLLPSAALMMLMSLVPIICRFSAKRAGVPSRSGVELFTQSAHFYFQVVQVFLVTTLTSAASAATSQIIQDPLSAKDLLAENLPKATNFYISYFLLEGLTMSSTAVLQIGGVLAFKFFATFLDRSPRNLYKRWASLSGLGWGNVFPVFTNMGVIALTYSCIAPLILGFAFVGLYLVYQAYRYNFLFVYDIRIDTKGLVYPRALSHLLTGIYLAEICMIGLFAIRGTVGPTVLMVILTIVTALAHVSLKEALGPVHTYLPRSLDTEEEYIRSQEDRDLEAKAGLLVAQCEIGSPSRRRWEAVWRWFHPNFYRDYASLRQKIRRDLVEIRYSEQEMRDAYLEPCIRRGPPKLWIPKDKWGLSQQEVRETELDSGLTISVTDKGAHLDEKNRIVWDKSDESLPSWELRVLY